MNYTPIDDNGERNFWTTKAGAAMRSEFGRLSIERMDFRAQYCRRGEAPALDVEDLVSYRRLAAREDPFGLAAWRRKLANRDDDGAKR